ncbi:MAG TPA: hypothetical protein VFQ35_24575 [Polyangiaceae bacterium]|nr:hypothetical protein [Polyangiaceae bacterium]
MQRLPLLFTLVVALAGCSNAPAAADIGDDGGKGGGAGASSGGAGGTGGKAQCDPGPGYGEAVEAQALESVSATLLDADGEPVADEVFFVCGVDLCSPPARTGADGRVTVSPATPLVEKKPAAKFGEGILTPRFAVLLPRESVIDLGVVHTARLPALSTGAPLVPGSEASSGGLTLMPSAGTQIKIDQLTYESAAEQAFRAVKVPLDRAPELIDASVGLEVVYGATPVETRFCPPAKLRIENTEGWTPNTDVEVLLHGVAIEEEFAPYGGWAKVSDARVSADGLSIETTSPGLPVLGVIGLRRK